ncbi:MAG: ATP-binding protein [Armatimonadota bacterium]|nr:ATP-binding protein [Armatimonadota bacterium]
MSDSVSDDKDRDTRPEEDPEAQSSGLRSEPPSEAPTPPAPGAADAPDSPRGLRRELEHYRLVVEEMRRRIRVLEDELEAASTIAEVPSVVVTRPELRNTLGRLVKKVAMIIQAEKVLLLLHQPEAAKLTVLPPALGVTEDQADALDMAVDEGVSGRVFSDRESIIFNDALNDPRTSKEIVSLLAVRNGICVPLVIKQRDEEERLVDERVIGVMNVFNKRFDEDFSKEDVRLLEMLAEQAAAVISNAQLYIQLTEEKEELQDAFESITVGVIVVNKAGTIRLLNPAAAEMLELPEKDYSGTKMTDVISGGPVRELVGQTLETGEERTAEISMGEDDGRIYQAQTTLMVREDTAEVENVVAIFNDITEIRRVERMKTAFVSTVSHELRTPLTSIKGFISTLLEDDEGMYDEETRREFLIIVNEECERLTRLISDLLNISKIESGRGLELNLSEVDLAQLLNRVASSHQPYTKKHRIVATVPNGMKPIRADADKLTQMLDNLVGNAVKYSPNGGIVKIAASDEDGAVRIDVTDQGLGIPERHRDRIFQRFHQVDDDVDHRSIGGTGIGLYLVQHLASAHGGRVWLDRSEVGEGSTFSIRLPKDPEKALE